MRRELIWGCGLSAVLLFSCTTDPCGCTPVMPNYHLVVLGNVSRPDQSAVPGARIEFGQHFGDGCSASSEFDEDFAAYYGAATTDEAGAFLIELFSDIEGQACLVLTAVSGSDTARAWQAAEFISDAETPDTVTALMVLGTTP